MSPRCRSRLRTSVLLATLATAACSPPPEYPLLQQFFSASRLRDTTALQNIATIVFEPREQGTITTFEITKVATRRDGDRELKEVTISAPVRLPSRETVQQTLVVTMEKVAGRWIVVHLARRT
jgi:hypothetical protein